jgi:dTDP-N-acetylfucosamine:lipid II N-acetylfucosaminyltransferase
MTTIFANAILRAPARTRVAWLGWGYDYYPLLAGQLGPPLLPATRTLVGADDDEPATDKSQALQRVASRLQSFSVLPTEVALLRRALPALTAPHQELPLFTAEDVFGRGGADMTGTDVLVGNSATASNNHLEAFEWLEGRAGIGRVVVPLSYGNAGYGRQVADAGRRVLGDRFDPLLDWMSIDDYNRRIAGCGFVLMNHRRQQAVGNVGAAVFRGATVILRPENPLFGFYRDLGLHLRSVDEIEAGAPLVPISDAQRAENRQRIGAHYARDRVVQAIRDLPALAG